TALHADRARRAIFTAASADARYVLVGMGDGTVNIWEPASEKIIASSTKHSSAIFAAAFSPDSRFVVTGDTSGVLWFWNPMTGEPFRSIQDDPSAVYSVAVSAGGHVAVGREDGNLSVFDAHTGQLLARKLAHPQGISTLAYSPDGYRLFTGGYDGLVTAWSTPDYREVATLPIQPIDDAPAKPDPRPSLLHFAPDSAHVTVFTEDGWLRTWDLRRPEE
ncbi:MAG: WD40 repeat domain-containing protein, partial [Opitutaceae bacterium]